jgi:RluA family pseudouridine synthase
MKKKNKLHIVYEDKDILVINKPAKLLTISTDKEKTRTLFHQVVDYLHTKNQKAFVVHRLDRDTSGLVVFAKNMVVKKSLQDNWDNTVRKYYAKVLGEVKTKGEIKSYLAETKTLLTYIAKDSKKGKLAITKYQPLESNKDYSMLDIEILTGRKNQIRVQLSSIGHPIIGDNKYGNNKASRLMLQAYYLEFKHPSKNEVIKLEIDNELKTC